jgi:hypothetical protein
MIGDTLYALDARTLKEVAKTTLEPAPSPPGAFRYPSVPPRADAPPPLGAQPLPETPERRFQRNTPLVPALPPTAQPPGDLPRPEARAPRAPTPDAPARPAEPFNGFRPFRPGVQPAPGFAPFAPTISATEKYVYVLRGNRLYAFDGKTLKEVSRTTLDAPSRSAEPRRP